MKSPNPLRSLGVLAVVFLAVTPLGTSGTVRGPEPGSFQILKAVSFVGDDGHLYTRADVSANGRVVRGVVAPGGRIGDRWEFVESLPAESGDHDAHSGDGSPTLEEFRTQSGDGAGTTVTGVQATSRIGRAAAASYSVLYGYGWCSRNLDAPYRINTARAPAGAVDAIRKGFNVWTNHSASWMSYVYRGTTNIASPSRDGVNVVWFASKPDGFIGRTWVYGTGNSLTGFDMNLNTRYRLTAGGSGYDIQSLVAHEAGHAAGFGHTSLQGNLMYGGGQPPSTYWRSLGSGDKAGLSYLYPYRDIRSTLVESSGPARLLPGGVGTFSATWENTGRTPWGGSRFPPLRVRASQSLAGLVDASWLDATLVTQTDAPTCKGERVTATWKVRAPGALGTLTGAFTPIAGPTKTAVWMSGSKVAATINVVRSTIGSGSGSGSGGGSGCFLFLCW